LFIAFSLAIRSTSTNSKSDLSLLDLRKVIPVKLVFFVDSAGSLPVLIKLFAGNFIVTEYGFGAGVLSVFSCARTDIDAKKKTDKNNILVRFDSLRFIFIVGFFAGTFVNFPQCGKGNNKNLPLGFIVDSANSKPSEFLQVENVKNNVHNSKKKKAMISVSPFLH
jgi:hypothetical protein